MNEPLPFLAAAADPVPAKPAVSASEALDHLSRCFGRGDFREARKYGLSAINAFPDNADIHHALGVVHAKLGDTLAAIACEEKTLILRPGLADAEHHLGALKERRKAIDEALAQHDARIADGMLITQSNTPDSYVDLGRFLLSMDEFAMAIASFRRGIERREGYADAFIELGFAFERCDQLHDAINCFRRAISIDPKNAAAIGSLARALQDAMLWDELDRFRAHQKAIAATLKGKASVAIDRPFANLIASEDPAENTGAAARYAALLESRAAALDLTLPPRPTQPCDGRIRIGYLSYDFRYHPVGQLAAPILAHHDRNRFEVFAYSIGPNDGSAERRTIEQSAEHFRDVKALGDSDIARLVHNDAIDVLIDLNGYTRGSRGVVAALRPAPIQVWMLGFPGTSGSSCIDYIIADPVTLPPEHLPHFSEQPCWLPHSCQTLDDGQPIADIALTRSLLDLPSTGPLFVSWQSAFKIQRRVFDIWVEILRAVPESHLWLRRCPDFVRANIAHALRRHELTPSRIVFAAATPHNKPTYLRCLALADIALDTFGYNGHATTSDLLWAGVPVITMLGQHFAGRVAASLLHAAELPELVTYSPNAYRDLAIKLARDPERLAALKQRLVASRTTAPLFDTGLYVRHLERGFESMMARHARGETPAPIVVEAGP
ncbi:MAG: hypothetical protein SGJ07_11520 [Rhodospirillaceae bacterium]|nr:hypothetical protein [Rhodospirillaceae bacterium]